MMDGYSRICSTADEARRLLSFSQYTTDADVARLGELLAETDRTDQAVVDVLCEHIADHIRGWFQPVFGFAYAEYVRRFAELYVGGYSTEAIRDFFICVAEGRKTLRDEPGAGAE